MLGLNHSHASLVVLCAVAPAPLATAQATGSGSTAGYTLTILSAPANFGTYATRVFSDASGQGPIIAGATAAPPVFWPQPCTWQSGTWSALPLPQGAYTAGISARDPLGTLAVNAGFPIPGLPQAYRYSNGTYEPLAKLGGADVAANAFDGQGRVVGSSQDGAGVTHAVRWDLDGSIEDLGSLGGAVTVAEAANSAGLVVGASQYAGTNVIRACVFQPSGARGLQVPPGTTHSRALDVNDNGEIVGFAGQLSSGSNDRAARWIGGTYQALDLDPTWAGATRATAINAVGAIVGTSTVSGGFLWVGGRAAPLADLVDEPVGWTFFSALDLGAQGEIVGVGTMNSEVRGYVLEPKVANVNHDFTVDARDAAAFRGAWLAGDSLADVDHDGDVDAHDRVRFVEAYALGR